MDEYVDILDEDGNYTLTSLLKSEAHRQGLFHPTVHIWCYDPQGLILLQQRGKHKKTFPLLWDVSVAGHVGAGESMEVGAEREVFEEIGVSIQVQKLEKLKIFKTEHRHSEILFDREFNHTFLYPLPQTTTLTPQASEVEALKWFTIVDFEKMVSENDPRLVPNSENRYQEVIMALKAKC
ncbi:MAG: NUDIX domain-containing protein [Bacteroidota bacterium]